MAPSNYTGVCNDCRQTTQIVCNDRCRQCVRNNNNAYSARNREKLNSRSRRLRTGWSPEAFKDAWVSQGGKCKICTLPMKDHGVYGRSVMADHFEPAVNKKIPRDLLCSSCNKGLGHFGDNLIILRRAADYVHGWYKKYNRSLDEEESRNAGGR